MLDVGNGCIAFKMIFEGWEVELFRPRGDSKEGYLKVEVESKHLPRLRGKILRLNLLKNEILSREIISNSAVYGINFPYLNHTNNFELSITLK